LFIVVAVIRNDLPGFAICWLHFVPPKTVELLNRSIAESLTYADSALLPNYISSCPSRRMVAKNRTAPIFT
jgi:hypothetical protein